MYFILCCGVVAVRNRLRIKSWSWPEAGDWPTRFARDLTHNRITTIRSLSLAQSKTEMCQFGASGTEGLIFFQKTYQVILISLYKSKISIIRFACWYGFVIIILNFKIFFSSEIIISYTDLKILRHFEK